MKAIFSLLLLLAIVAAPGTWAIKAQADSPITRGTVVGRWEVKFALVGGSEKHLIFEAGDSGTGSLKLLDTGVDDKPVAGLQSAVWSLTNNSLSISSEVELPIGTCCRETGALILKSKPTSPNSFTGKLVFVTNIDEEESPYKYRTTVGTFTATRMPAK